MPIIYIDTSLLYNYLLAGKAHLLFSLGFEVHITTTIDLEASTGPFKNQYIEFIETNPFIIDATQGEYVGTDAGEKSIQEAYNTRLANGEAVHYASDDAKASGIIYRTDGESPVPIHRINSAEALKLGVDNGLDPVEAANARDALKATGRLQQPVDPAAPGYQHWPSDDDLGVHKVRLDYGQSDVYLRIDEPLPPGAWTQDEQFGRGRISPENAAAAADLKAQRGSILSDPASYDADGNLTPQAAGLLDALRVTAVALGAAITLWDIQQTLADVIPAWQNGNHDYAIEELSALAGRNLGGWAAGLMGFQLGAELGAFAGPWGMLIGGLIGGALFGFYGSELGDDFGRSISEFMGDLGDLLRDILSDPLVLDLDGDGIELTALAVSATRFDLDNDASAERVGWVSPHDGLLVNDANANGLVDGVDELLGSANVDGYDELATLDSNQDGYIDAADASFEKLLVWRDLNSDGISTADEISNLQQAGIARLKLAFSQVDTPVGGNIIARVGTYVREDGSTRAMGSVQFAIDKSSERPILPEDADLSSVRLLPNLAASATTPSLWVAMYFDPVLRELVEELVYGEQSFTTFVDFAGGGAEMNGPLASIEGRFIEVLYRWAGIDTSMPADPDRPYYLEVIEALAGIPLEALNPHQRERLAELWPEVVKQLGVQFLFQASSLAGPNAVADLIQAISSIDPSSSDYLPELAAVIGEAAMGISLGNGSYDYLALYRGLSYDRGSGELTGDFDAFARQFVNSQPSFEIISGSGGSSADTITMAGVGGDFRHPWSAWYEDQGSLLFYIADAMGIGTDYVLNVTGWRWLTGGATDIRGGVGDDIMDFPATLFTQIEEEWRPGGKITTITQVPTRDQRLFGMDGDDELRGNDGVDSLIGGRGNDLLKGGSGSDMYVYASGDGLDRIIDDSGIDDTIYFSSELNRSDLRVSRITGTNDLQLHFGNSSTGIVLTNQWSSASAAVEHLHFVGEDGLDAGNISSLYLATLATSGADSITGSWAGERVIGLDGNDILSGADGDDTLEGDSGDDNLNGGNGNDTIRGGQGNDVVHGGTSGSDVLVGGAGNDTLHGGRGSVTLVYSPGDGDDVFQDDTLYDDPFAPDTLLFGAGIAPADIRFSRGATITSMRITFVDRSGSIVFNNQWWADAGIETISFADGTIWSEVEFAARYVAAQTTAADDTVWGTSWADSAAGNDGNDLIQAWHGDDTVIGGRGNDRLEGGNGGDTYIYHLGDGDDLIVDGKQTDSVIDTLIFGQGIAPSSLILSRVASDWSDVRIEFVGQSGSIIIDNQQWSDYGIEVISFADGTVWMAAEFMARYVSDQQTAGDDVIHGSGGSDLVDAGSGNDSVIMGGGNDTLIGGLGNDRLEGGNGQDTYVYSLGDGDDFIVDGKESDNFIDTLVLGQGITPSNLILSRVASDWSDVRIGFVGHSGSITIDNQQWGDYGIEAISFADGTIWTPAEFMSRYVSDQQTSGDDVIHGSGLGDLVEAGAGNDTVITGGGSDTIIGGLGNDRLEGGDGRDTYIYNAGDGNDLIIDGKDSDSVIDTLVFGAGIILSELIFSRVVEDAADLRITFKNASGSIIVDRQTWGDMGIELFVFSDGSTITQAQANALIISAKNGNDTINGTAEDDSIWALEGADVVSGLAGADSLYGQDGNDILSGGDGADILEGGVGADILTGGSEADVFRFFGNDSGVGTAADRITDFVSGTDLLDLSQIDSDPDAIGDQGFVFIGGAAFSGTAGELRYRSDGTDTWLEVDMNGDAMIDLEIVMTGTLALLASDFVS